MREMNIEKVLDLSHKVDQIENIEVYSNLLYRVEKNGIKAVGDLLVTGNYQSDDLPYDIEETVDLEIMAPFEKIEDGKNFSVEISSYHHYIENGDVVLVIVLQLLGIKPIDEVIEEKTDHTSSKVEEPKMEPVHMEEKRVEVDTVVNEVENEIEEEVVDLKALEDLFDDDDTMMADYRLVKAKASDTYTSLASVYHVDVNALIKKNHNKIIEQGTIIYLP